MKKKVRQERPRHKYNVVKPSKNGWQVIYKDRISVSPGLLAKRLANEEKIPVGSKKVYYIVKNDRDSSVSMVRMYEVQRFQSKKIPDPENPSQKIYPFWLNPNTGERIYIKYYTKITKKKKVPLEKSK